MNFKRFSTSDNQWHDVPYYIHNTSTDTLTTLPAVLYPNAVTATVGLKGNMEQTSQPSPTTPIQPSECGERTENLFDEIYPDIIYDIPRYKSVYVGNGTFTLSTNTPMYGQSAVLFLLAGNVSSGASTPDNGVSVGISRTVTAIDGYVTIAYRWYTGTNPRNYQTMLNTGSTALPYEPYGVKIPISSASTTTPVYLGEVQTTRKIGKLVLTGNENWVSKGNPATFRYENSPILDDLNSVCYCSHFKNLPWAQVGTTNNSFVVWLTSAENTINIRCEDYSTVEDFKAFLSAQYQNGTPVTIWYVLAEPTTGIVNEPIRKIGDYADEVSGITIPTIAGANTLSIGTTLQPSEVTATYKGWHPVADVHEKSRNLFDKSTVINGKRIDAEGEPFDSETCSLSQFIKVTPSSVINQGYNFSYNDCMAEYDINKAIIARHVSGNGVVTLDNSTHYIRVAVSTSRLDSVMVNEGSTSLPYEPYWT